MHLILIQPLFLRTLQFLPLTFYCIVALKCNFSSKVSENDVLDSFFTSDLNVVYQLKPSKIFKTVTFTALINNIFNAEYVDRGYYYTYDDTWSNSNSITTLDGAGYYPQATRNFLLGITLNF